MFRSMFDFLLFQPHLPRPSASERVIDVRGFWPYPRLEYSARRQRMDGQLKLCPENLNHIFSGAPAIPVRRLFKFLTA